MLKKLYFTVLILMQQIASFSQTPHLTGTLTISKENGTFDADFKLSNVPSISNYNILLNSGFNIAYFRDEGDKFNYGYNYEYLPQISEEAFQYFFPAKDSESKFLPNAFLVKYTGKFPVFKDSSKASDWNDWKGNIACNGKTLRASEQSAWYPILYNKTEDFLIDKYTFDIIIKCVDCEAIYVNGDVPKKGIENSFQSSSAVSLLIFAGDFSFDKIDDIYLVNTNISENQQIYLMETTNSIIKYYENLLQIPYGKSVVYLATTPVSRKNEWLFVTYPTIAIIGIDKYKFENYFDDSTQEFKNQSNISFIAHELAHYYIGTVFNPNSTLRWFFLEGLTEYLALQLTKNMLGKNAYQLKIQQYIKNVSKLNPIGIHQVHMANQINEVYRYHYVPLLLTAIESEIGEEKMWQWIRIIITSKNIKTDYSFFKASLKKTGVSAESIQKIEKRFVKSKLAKSNITNAVKK